MKLNWPLFKKNYDKIATLNIISNILSHAYRLGAANVYFEPHPEISDESYLVFAEAEEKTIMIVDLPRHAIEHILTRIKYMANLSTSNTQGTIEVRMEDRKTGLRFECDLGVTLSSTPFGEKFGMSIHYFGVTTKMRWADFERDQRKKDGS